ncbi:MAG: hypothetical protein WC782_07150 [Methylococcaceae bacterium]|jgi:hypothetical protein
MFQQRPATEFLSLWITMAGMASLLVIYIASCHFFAEQLQQIGLAPDQLELARTVFYVLAIVLFPLTNLIRFILLRLNQTMPGEDASQKRYAVTVLVSLVLIESTGVFGMVMFMLGDGMNTLYIFTGLAALGLYVHRPKQDELLTIILARQNQPD